MMQKTLKTISILLFIAVGALAFSGRTKADFYAENSVVEKTTLENSDTSAAKELYVRNCARCHGANGAGETELGKKLDVPDLSISGKRMSQKKITRIVTSGKEEMPAFGKKLSRSQIASIAAYVRKL